MKRDPSIRQFLIAAAVCAAVVLCCLLLYRYDNKYTHPGPQAQDGVLTLTETGASQSPVLYLVEGWEYYGGRLLTPADFGNTRLSPDEVIFIGQYGGFERNDSSLPHGSGSYRLRLHLPETPHTYMLELPEIFSSYKLYLNDMLMMEMGETDPGDYYPETGNRTLSFAAGGSVDLLIAVTDYSHLYSGMVYPPAFGQPEAVAAVLNVRLVIRSIVCTAALTIGLLALFTGILGKQKKLSLLYGLLCLFFTGYAGYPIRDTFWSGFSEKYMLENLCFNALILIVLLLQHRITAYLDIQRIPSRYLIVPGVMICAVTITFHTHLPSGYLWMMQAYSMLISVYQWAAAAFLTANAFIAIRRSRQAAPLFYGILVFDCTLVMDRLLPLFEPIISGWFIEIGSFVLLLTLGLTTGREVILQYRQSAVLTERARNAELLNQTRESYYTALQGQIRQTNAAKHDLRHHFVTISGLVKSQQYDELEQYLIDYGQSFQSDCILNYCANEVVNVLAHYFRQLAKQHDIPLDIKISLEEKITITDTEWSALLSNLLENAMEACLRLPKERRFINFSMNARNQDVFVYMENSASDTPDTRNPLLFKKEKEQRGYGLVSIRSIAEKYDGNAEFYMDSETGIYYSMVYLSSPL